MVIGITGCSILNNLNHYSLATNSPSYKSGLVSNASVTHTTTDINNKTRASSNNPSIGSFGWTL